MEGNERLALKWGTLKGWDVQSEKCLEAIERYHSEPTSYSVMAQRDTDTQRQALYDLIDALDGKIWNDWSGETMTKDEAKNYIKDYKYKD